MPAGGSVRPASAETVAGRLHTIHMLGSEVYKYATRQMADSALAALRNAGLAVDDVDQFVFHQANLRIIKSVEKQLNIPEEKVFVNIEKYGNTSAASVPMALAEAVAAGRIQVGDRVLMVAFGAGYTAGAAVVEWTADPARAFLAPGEQTRLGRPHGRGARAGSRALMFDLTGKVALVTGGSRGLGRAIALAFAAQGADVAVNYRGDQAAADETVAGIRGAGRKGEAIQGDTSAGRESCEEIVKAAIAAFGAIDILVNNAGITRDNLLMRMDEEEWDAVISTNLAGPFWMTRAVARPDDEGALRPHHQHVVGSRPDGEPGTGQLRRRQGGAHRPHQDDRSRAGQPRHHLQRHRARA